MFNKLLILSSLFLSLLFSNAESSPEHNAIADSTIVHELTTKIRDIKETFNDSLEMSIKSYKENSAYLDQIIELFTSYAQKDTGKDFTEPAVTYLELKKNLGILNLFQNSLIQSDTDSGEAELSIIDLLQDTSRVSPTGRSLFSFMKQPLEIPDLQKNFLDDNEAILNYFILNNKIYVYLLTRVSLQTIQWEIPADSVRSLIKILLSPFYNAKDLLRLEFNIPISFQLYQYLFQPLEKYVQPYKILYIIPHDFLVGFPFELLVTDTTKSIQYNKEIFYHRHSQLNYLIKNYAISYNFSNAVFFLAKDLDRTTHKLGHRLLTMSEPLGVPNSDNIDNSDHALPRHELEYSDYASDEIKRVSRLLFRHDNLIKEQAVKSYLFENGKYYRWLYFALPGILDNSNPLDSRILFSPEHLDSLNQPGWLTAREAIAANLAADLLTLSSSEAVEYSTDGNPGVLAMSQSFLFSGVKSILFSLWRINSISTSQFMSKFYWELKYKRQTNAQALQEAKIASMKDTFIFNGKKISRAHPYFWATFQLVGNPKIRPPSPTRLPPWGVVIIVYVCVIVGTLYITRKTLPNRR